MTLFSVVNKNYYIKVRLPFQILSTQTKIWPVVLINSITIIIILFYIMPYTTSVALMCFTLKT